MARDSRLPDISSLSMGELHELALRVEKQRERKREEARRWLRERVGQNVVERKPLYRNPENPCETWSGKGPEPAWVRDLRARGIPLEDLRRSDDLPSERS